MSPTPGATCRVTHLEQKPRMFRHLPVMLALLIVLSCFAWEAAAQTVKHPLSEITTSISRFSYTYKLSETKKKEIKYIVVRDSKNEVKTVFNACDVCYLTRKGYSQSGTEVVCNNCGNRFPIDGLGNNNTSGTCNPGYLPHTIEGDFVVLEESELIKGEYFFALETITSIDDPITTPDGISLRVDHRLLTVELPREAQREFHLFNIQGERVTAFTDESRTVTVDLSNYSTGSYFLVIDDRGTNVIKKILVY